MKVRKLTVLKEVAEDLEEGRLFYDRKEPGIGDYFFDSLISNLESLKLYAGIHSKRFGYHRMLSKRFPFAIYYEVEEDTAISSCCFGYETRSCLDSWEIRKKI